MNEFRQPLISVVLPVFQESSHLTTVVARVDRELVALNVVYEIILVDDGSYDDTWGVIVDEAARRPLLRGLQLSRNFGKEAAIIAGLRIARGATVLVMDADLQHPPELIPVMFAVWQKGEAEIVEAVKALRGEESWGYQLSARLFYAVMNRTSGFNMANSSDFKLMDRKVVKVLLTLRERNTFYRGLTEWVGFRKAQIPFDVPERIGGGTKWSLQALVKFSANAVTSFSTIPLFMVSLSGMIFFLFAVALGAQTLFVYLSGKAVSGFTTVILLILITGSWIMICLGIVGEYLGRIFEEVKGRPRFIVKNAINSEGDHGDD